MNPRLLKLTLLLNACVLLATISLAQDAKEIVRRADQKMKGASSYAEMEITTVRKTYSRTMHVRVHSKGNDYTLIEIVSPIKDKGIKFLRRKKEVWNWIPSIERTIKLPPSMMNQSWMGTDFTNDDLVKEASILEDYSHDFNGKSMINGRSCYKITLIPLPDASVVWGKVVLHIDEKEDVILVADYYDEDNQLVNHMVASDLKLFDGRLLPSRMEMTPTDKPENKTVLIYRALKFNVQLEDNLFSPQYLQVTQ